MDDHPLTLSCWLEWARSQGKDETYFLLYGCGSKAAVNSFNKQSRFMALLEAHWPEYSKAPQMTTLSLPTFLDQQSDGIENKGDIAYKVYSPIWFLKCVDKGNGTLESMTWTLVQDLEEKRNKTEMLFRDYYGKKKKSTEPERVENKKKLDSLHHGNDPEARRAAKKRKPNATAIVNQMRDIMNQMRAEITSLQNENASLREENNKLRGDAIGTILRFT